MSLSRHLTLSLVTVFVKLLVLSSLDITMDGEAKLAVIRKRKEDTVFYKHNPHLPKVARLQSLTFSHAKFLSSQGGGDLRKKIVKLYHSQQGKRM